MKSLATPDFWERYAKLPREIKRRARAAFRLWQDNSRHPSLCFKKVGDIWSVRIGKRFRALALQDNDSYIWFWIGTHDEYGQMLQK